MQNRERLIDGEQMTPSRGSHGVEGLSTTEKGHMDMGNSVLIAEGRGVYED